MPSPLEVVSVKIRLQAAHVRAVPRHGLDGCAFGGPGVDLFGAEALRVVSAAEPIFAGLRALEPGTMFRAVSIDFSRFRVLATLEPGPKPRVVRVEGALPERWLAEAQELVPVLEACMAGALARRSL